MIKNNMNRMEIISKMFVFELWGLAVVLLDHKLSSPYLCIYGVNVAAYIDICVYINIYVYIVLIFICANVRVQ